MEAEANEVLDNRHASLEEIKQIHGSDKLPLKLVRYDNSRDGYTSSRTLMVVVTKVKWHGQVSH